MLVVVPIQNLVGRVAAFLTRSLAAKGKITRMEPVKDHSLTLQPVDPTHAAAVRPISFDIARYRSRQDAKLTTGMMLRLVDEFE